MKPTLNKMSRFISDRDYRHYVISTNWERWRKKHNRGIADPPRTVVLIVTNDCNLRCPMCSVANHGEDFRRLDMPLELAFKVLEEIRAWKPFVVLCGGEPLIYRNWKPIIQKCTEFDIRTNITTNGLLLSRQVSDVVESGLTELSVSLDGVGSLHDRIRDRDGLFDRAIQAIKEILSLRDSRGLFFPEVSLCFTISEKNYHQMLEYAEYAEHELPGVVRLSYLHLVFADPKQLELHNRIFREMFNQEAPPDYRPMLEPQRIDVQLFLRQMEKIRGRKWPFEVDFRPNHPPEEIQDYYLNPEYKRRSLVECDAPWHSIMVQPDGMATPCLNYLVGNVQKENLLKIWNNRQMRKFRVTLAENGRFPLCHRCCF